MPQPPNPLPEDWPPPGGDVNREQRRCALPWFHIEEPLPAGLHSATLRYPGSNSKSFWLAATAFANNFRMNRLFFGDNRGCLRDTKELPDASVDLVYLDLPFNSNADYV